jgi:hypothetical protein
MVRLKVAAIVRLRRVPLGDVVVADEDRRTRIGRVSGCFEAVVAET